MFKWDVTIKIIDSENKDVKTLKEEVWADTIGLAKIAGHKVADKALDLLKRTDVWYKLEVE